MSVEIYRLADPEYYAPLTMAAGRGPLLRPASVAAGWTSRPAGMWTRLAPDDRQSESQPMRVHAAAGPDRLQSVLDTFAAACFKRGIAFRHLANETVHRFVHHEHGSPTQAGKFCTAYPADEDAASELAQALAGLAVVVGERPAALWSSLRPDGTRRLLSEDDLLEGPVPVPVPPPGYEIVQVRRSGGSGFGYTARGTDGGGVVFVKQVSSHGGLTDDGRTAAERLRDELRVLERVHAEAPGLAPRPVAHIQEGPYEYLLSEFVPGVPLASWVVANSPLPKTAATPEDWVRYHQRAEVLIGRIERDVLRLADLGCARRTVAPWEVLVDHEDAVRITGFSAVPDPLTRPEAAVAEAAFFVLGPLGSVVRRTAEVLPHIHHDLTGRGPLPPALWVTATRFAAPRPDPATPALPTPEEIDADERGAVSELRDRIATAILAAAADDPVSVFPTVPQGHMTNTLSVAYGTAGVVHALRRAHLDAPDWIVRRLRDDALAQAGDLAPGLYTGTAGIAWVLADLGLLDEAARLLAVADRHPLTCDSATLAWGAAGVAMAHLAMYGHSGDEHHVEQAQSLLTFPHDAAELTALLGPHDMTGLWYGRTGVAHALQQLAAVTGDSDLRRRGLRLLHAELDRAVYPAPGEIVFPVSARDRRRLYYLYCGTAGFLRTAIRYLAEEPDERLAEALPKLARKCGMTVTAHAGLGQGQAGLGFALAEHAEILGDAGSGAAAWRAARALFQHAVPGSEGVRVLGDLRLRYSCELWSGSAGVLLFLSYLLDPAADALFTVDALKSPLVAR